MQGHGENTWKVWGEISGFEYSLYVFNSKGMIYKATFLQKIQE